MESLSIKSIKQYEKKYEKKKNNLYLTNSISNNNFDDLVINRNFIQKKNNKYTNIINKNIKVSNQYKSGRCWLFSFLNLLRQPIIKKYKLSPQFELSQNYLFFAKLFFV